MKIGIVLSKPPSYSETFFNSKINGLIEYGYDVALYVREHTEDYATCKVYNAPRVFKNPILQAFRTGFVVLSLVFYLKRILKFIRLETSSGRRITDTLKNCYKNAHLLKAKVDWLHFGFATLAIGSEHIAKSIDAKMAISCRGYDMDVYPLKHKNCYLDVFKNVDKVHAISANMLKKAFEHGLNPLTPNAIIYPAIDTKGFRDFTISAFKLSPPIQITTIARLHWIKGLDYTLEALQLLKQKGVKFNYTIIGEGSEYESLRYALHELDLENEVSFLGKLSHETTLEHLKNTDIYLQYSHTEGFCNAVLEAQAMGCLCVVSDGGGLPENIIDNTTGFLVKKRDANALAESIFRVLSMDELDLSQIKKAARTRVLKDFTIDNQIQTFINFYE
ncbi:glycosyltransferase family 4 protein [Winogradskyella litorisediminis]|uniref:Glycosyltransferase family 4 protein n=1 Tax=Winogradskyella litorisediminis TaxID=1156618 RepID=A0ABW3NCW9_9FLAO